MTPTTERTVPALWGHQQKALDFILARRATMLWMGVGTGKSAAAIHALKQRDCRRVLVLAPLSVVPVWTKQFFLHADFPYRVLCLDTGGVAQKTRLAARLLDTHTAAPGEMAVVCTNYDSAWREPLASWLLDPRRQWDAVVLDECHRLKGYDSKVSLYAGRLCPKIPMRLGLTGTMLPNGPLEAWAQFRAVAPTVFQQNYHGFANYYATTEARTLWLPGREPAVKAALKRRAESFAAEGKIGQPQFNAAVRFSGSGRLPPPQVVLKETGLRLPEFERTFREVTGWQNLEDFDRRLASCTFRVDSSVLDLPEAVHREVPVRLSPACRSLYVQMEAELEAGGVTAANALVACLRLRQIACGTLSDGEHSRNVDDGKFGALMDLLEDLPPKEPVVFFACFHADLDRCHAAAAALGRKSFELSGRRKETGEWQDASGGEVLAVQVESGLGVDLTRASQCVFWNAPWSNGSFEQALGRTHRPGQKSTVVYHHFIAQDTIEEAVYGSLRKKRNVVEAVVQRLRRSQEVRDGGK